MFVSVDAWILICSWTDIPSISNLLRTCREIYNILSPHLTIEKARNCVYYTRVAIIMRQITRFGMVENTIVQGKNISVVSQFGPVVLSSYRNGLEHKYIIYINNKLCGRVLISIGARSLNIYAYVTAKNIDMISLMEEHATGGFRSSARNIEAEMHIEKFFHANIMTRDLENIYTDEILIDFIRNISDFFLLSVRRMRKNQIF